MQGTDQDPQADWRTAYDSFVVLTNFDSDAFDLLIGRPSPCALTEPNCREQSILLTQDPQGFHVAPLGTPWMTFAHAQARMPYLSKFATAFLVYESDELGACAIWQVWENARCVRSIANSWSQTQALPGTPIFNAKKVQRDSYTGGPIHELGEPRDDDPEYFDDYMHRDELTKHCLRLGKLPSKQLSGRAWSYRLPSNPQIVEW